MCKPTGALSFIGLAKHARSQLFWNTELPLIDIFRSDQEPLTRSSLSVLKAGGRPMGKEPKDDPRRQSDQGSHKQTDEPWKGNPEKEQRNSDIGIDLEKWHRTNTH